MKQYTEILINKPEGGHKWYKSDPPMDIKHYEAKHNTENIYLLWMETRMMRRRCALPCALVEDGEALVCRRGGFAASKENVNLIRRWNLLVNPAEIDTAWTVNELDKEKFREIYKKFQDGPAPKNEEAEEKKQEEENTEE